MVGQRIARWRWHIPLKDQDKGICKAELLFPCKRLTHLLGKCPPPATLPIAIPRLPPTTLEPSLSSWNTPSSFPPQAFICSLCAQHRAHETCYLLRGALSDPPHDPRQEAPSTFPLWILWPYYFKCLWNYLFDACYGLNCAPTPKFTC